MIAPSLTRDGWSVLSSSVVCASVPWPFVFFSRSGAKSTIRWFLASMNPPRGEPGNNTGDQDQGDEHQGAAPGLLLLNGVGALRAKVDLERQGRNRLVERERPLLVA